MQWTNKVDAVWTNGPWIDYSVRPLRSLNVRGRFSRVRCTLALAYLFLGAVYKKEDG